MADVLIASDVQSLREGLTDGSPGAALELCHKRAKGRERLREAVEAWGVLTDWYRRERERERESVFLTVGGYDDDARELWEVPAVVAFVTAWTVKTGIVAPPSGFGSQSLTLRALPEGILTPLSVEFLLRTLQAAAGTRGPYRDVVPCDPLWRRKFSTLVRGR